MKPSIAAAKQAQAAEQVSAQVADLLARFERIEAKLDAGGSRNVQPAADIADLLARFERIEAKLDALGERGNKASKSK